VLQCVAAVSVWFVSIVDLVDHALEARARQILFMSPTHNIVTLDETVIAPQTKT